MKEPYRIQRAYKELNSSTDFQRFIKSAEMNRTEIYAIWDDHDYGKNDSGKEYKHKQISKKYFMEFFDIEKTVPPVDKPGIYRSKVY